MANIPSVSSKRLVRALEKLGCIATRQRGSHVTVVNHRKMTVTSIAMHPGEMKRNHIRTILKQIGISEEEFRNAL
jgi:predicted RNA binding protein YcfA (HicA-like mRNA interferase family)